MFERWRASSKQHLSNLELTSPGKLEYKEFSHDDRKNETLTMKAVRLAPVERLWELSNDPDLYLLSIMNDKESIKALQSSNEELEIQLQAIRKSPLKRRDINKRLMQLDEISSCIAMQTDDIAFLSEMLIRLETRSNAVTSAQAVFDQYFNRINVEFDQQVQDTLMVLNVMLHECVSNPNFQRVQVLSVSELDKANDLMLQIECENVAKTEQALKAFHENNLRHLQPDLRPPTIRRSCG